jgi:NitT/TauT family transport system ATP-binding protein
MAESGLLARFSQAVPIPLAAEIHCSPGELLALVGPSGSGKSTILRAVAGLYRPHQGTVRIGGAAWFDSASGVFVPPHERRVGLVFQSYALFPWKTVRGNVEFGLKMKGKPSAERCRIAQEFIDLVKLTGFEDRYPTELSGGMRQRVAIARTLVMEPKLILMDEPFGALDEQTRLILGEELLRIREATSATVLFITHSFDEALLLSDRIVVMTARPGRVKKIVSNPLPRPRDSTIVSDPEFGRLSGELWESLREESMQALAGERR